MNIFFTGPCNTSVSTYGNSSDNQTVTFYFNSGAQDSFISRSAGRNDKILIYQRNFTKKYSDQSNTNSVQSFGEPITTLMEESCEMLNAKDTSSIMSSGSRKRLSSTDSNDSESPSSKKSKTTDWRGKKRTEMEEMENKISNVNKEIEDTESEIQKKDIYLAGLQKRPIPSTPTYSRFFEHFHYMEVVEKDVNQMEIKLEKPGKTKTQQIGSYITNLKDLLKQKQKLLGLKQSLNKVLDDQINKNK